MMATPMSPRTAEDATRRVSGSSGSIRCAKSPAQSGKVEKSTAVSPDSIHCSPTKMQA